jgi:polyribonucleotide nucleotidyltransferase
MDLVPKIFEQSKEGRMHVLDEMEKVIKQPKESVSAYAPKMVTTKIDPQDIGVVIGAGGKVIRGIQEKTGAEISIEEDGTVVASAIDENAAIEAIKIIENMLKDIEVGEVYEGKVVEILDFGALVEILPGKVGLVHVSELANQFVENVQDFVNNGDVVQVKVLDVDRRSGKISLSKKALEPGYEENAGRGRDDRHGGGNGFRDRNRGGNRDRGGRSDRRR